MKVIRKIISIVIALIGLLFLGGTISLFIDKNIDSGFFGLFITSLIGFLSYKIYPKSKESHNKINRKNKTKKYDNKETTINSKDVKPNTSNLNANPSSSNENKYKNITIHSIVVGTKHDGRIKKFKRLVKDLKEFGYWEKEDLYEGYTNKEIKEDLLFLLEDEVKVYELKYLELPFVTIKPEKDNPHDKNAIAVYVGESEEKSFKLGYLPKGDARRIQDLVNKGTLVDVNIEIKGGKYKFLDFDESGKEVIRTRTDDYLFDLEIYFTKEM